MENNQAIHHFPYKQYSNFVKASLEQRESKYYVQSTKICGLDAKRMYLEEVTDVETSDLSQPFITQPGFDENLKNTKNESLQVNISTRELIAAVQSNDSSKVRIALLSCPDRVNITDEFGWSLLMIACQANSVETVKELLKQGADSSIRDKAGNSARSLVIKNKNATLASLILSHNDYTQRKAKERPSTESATKTSEFVCIVCDGRKFKDQKSHIASTLHNINVSKGRKIPPLYKIPESNKGFQIMLKSGWDKDIGLGASGSGIKYPIKCVPKKDRKGLGNDKNKKQESKTDIISAKRSNVSFTDKQRDRAMEVQFRREFY